MTVMFAIKLLVACLATVLAKGARVDNSCEFFFTKENHEKLEVVVCPNDKKGKPPNALLKRGVDFTETKIQWDCWSVITPFPILYRS